VGLEQALGYRQLVAVSASADPAASPFVVYCDGLGRVSIYDVRFSPCDYLLLPRDLMMRVTVYHWQRAPVGDGTHAGTAIDAGCFSAAHRYWRPSRVLVTPENKLDSFLSTRLSQ
jgi:hypothetical protein